MNQLVIEAHDLRVRFDRAGSTPVSALAGLDLSVSAGEFVAVIGQSGAGKTTLLRCLTGFIRPTSGRLIVDGTDVSTVRRKELYALRRRIATIYQHFNLIERATALENVLHGRLGYTGTFRSLMGLFTRADRERAYQLLIELGLGDQALQRVDQLSGGERQRVAIARALAQESRIVLADEPAASLDLALTRMVLDTLQLLHQNQELTILVNMHDLALARAYANRIIGLRDGKLVFDGPPEQLSPDIVERIYHDSEHTPEKQPVLTASCGPARLADTG